MILDNFSYLPNLKIGNKDHCLYCGSTPECLDHLIPYSYYNLNNKRRKHNKIVVYSCLKCNNLLSNIFFKNLEERLFYAQKRIFLKNAKILKTAEFTKKELNEFEYSLQKLIKRKIKLKKSIIAKLAWQISITFKEIINNIREEIEKKENAIDKQIVNYFFNSMEYGESERILKENIDLLIETGKYQTR